MIHLRSIEVRSFGGSAETYPFNLPVVQSLSTIEFKQPVTFFVGENGSGKSTVLESLACATESIAVGSESVKTDKTLEPVRKLGRSFKLVWQRRTHKGFFLRAEDFFGYARNLRLMREDLEREVKAVDEEYKGRSKLATDLARSAYLGQIAALKQRYGRGLDLYSHGESFMTLFQSRFVPDGLYLLDEPEAALSPTRQLAFLSALKEMVAQDSQFVIATHSPIILAFPQAEIYQFAEGQVQRVQYDDLEHVSLTRDFLNAPEAFLKHL